MISYARLRPFARSLRRAWPLSLVTLLALHSLSGCASSTSTPSGSGGSASGSGGGSSPGTGGRALTGGTGGGAGPGTGGNVVGPGTGGGNNPGSGGGSPGTGGAAGGSVTVGPSPISLTCPGITIAAADVISDFRTPSPIMYQQGTRGGTVWYAYGSEDPVGPGGMNIPTGASTPGVGSNAFEVDTTMPGPCNESNGALKVSSTGNSGYGVGFGVNLAGDVVPATVPPKKMTFDATGYTGIGFFLKCQAETDFIFVKTVDRTNDADVPNPVCNYVSSPICNQYGLKNLTGLTDWTYEKVYFSEMLQDWDSATISPSAMATNALTAFQLQMNTKYTRDGSARVASPFTCWVDDVHFLKDTAPSANANVMPKTCTSNATAAAPGGYTTVGNQIMDCKTGTPKIFRGIARPSLEWDRAGWNVTYDDLARIKSWNANVVRFSLNQSFWLDPAKGGLYQRTVDRAVKWTLSLGMDVILDLHWLTNGQVAMPDGMSSTFWSQVAAKYAGDGRVIFELFNEPFPGDAGTWKSGMQAVYNAVRGAAGSPKNLVLAGGMDYAYRLDQALAGGPLSGTNIAYVTHPYQFKAANATAWDGAFGNLAATYPIIATEFGQANISQPGGSQTCDGNFYSTLIGYFKTKNIGWTAWSWYVDRAVTNPAATCGFPQVITGYSGATNAAGTAVKTALAQ